MMIALVAAVLLAGFSVFLIWRNYRLKRDIYDFTEKLDAALLPFAPRTNSPEPFSAVRSPRASSRLPTRPSATPRSSSTRARPSTFLVSGPAVP